MSAPDSPTDQGLISPNCHHASPALPQGLGCHNDVHATRVAGLQFNYIAQARCSLAVWPEWRALRSETGRMHSRRIPLRGSRGPVPLGSRRGRGNRD